MGFTASWLWAVVPRKAPSRMLPWTASRRIKGSAGVPRVVHPSDSGHLWERFLAAGMLQLLTASAPARSALLPTLHPASTLLREACGALSPAPSCWHPAMIWQSKACAALRQASTLLRTTPRATALASAASGGTTVLSRSPQRVRQQSMRTATRPPRMARTRPATGRTWPAWGRTPRMRQVQGPGCLLSFCAL